MIKVSVMYPNNDGGRFDIDYYCTGHMDLVREKLGAACKRIAVDYGLGGGAPGSQPTYVAIGHLHFDSVDVFQAAFGPHADVIMADLANFTNIQPTIQISDVRM